MTPTEVPGAWAFTLDDGSGRKPLKGIYREDNGQIVWSAWIYDEERQARRLDPKPRNKWKLLSVKSKHALVLCKRWLNRHKNLELLKARQQGVEPPKATPVKPPKPQPRPSTPERTPEQLLAWLRSEIFEVRGLESAVREDRLEEKTKLHENYVRERCATYLKWGCTFDVESMVQEAMNTYHRAVAEIVQRTSST